MSRTSLRDAEDRTSGVSSRPQVSRRSVSRRPTKMAAVACLLVATGTARLIIQMSTLRALMYLALPTFDGLEDRTMPAHRPWMVSTDSPASPYPVCLTDLLRSPSPCLNLDALSSDDAEESVTFRLLRYVVRKTAIPLLIQIRSCRMTTCRLRGSRDRRQVIRIRTDCTDCGYFSGWSGLGFPTVGVCGAPKG